MKVYRNITLGGQSLLNIARPTGPAPVSGEAGDIFYTSSDFNLPIAGVLSAGFYHTQTGVLGRTLYNNRSVAAGKQVMPTFPSDNLDDEGRVVNPANYTPRVMFSNTTYTWLKPIGNSSNIIGGPKVHHNFEVIQDMAAASSYMYYVAGYNEHNAPFSKFHVDRPNERIGILEHIHFGMQALQLCSDGKLVYFAGTDVDLGGGHTTDDSFVMAIRTSDDQQHSFSTGQRFVLASNHSYDSIVCYLRSPLARPTGCAVQRSDNGYFFVARGAMNTVHVYNKTTMALVQTQTGMGNVRKLDVDANGDLWSITDTNTVRRYTVNADGTLSATVTTLNVATPGDITCNQQGTRIAVIDKGDQQIVRYFSLTGVPQGTWGQTGGYATTVTVAPDRLMFDNPTRSTYQGHAAFQSDGYLWVGDAGCFRNQCVSPTGTVNPAKTIQYLCHSRSMGVDKAAPRRVFTDYLEFDYNYETGENTLKKNYLFNFRANQDSEFHRLKWVTTYSNGRTYAFMPHPTQYAWQVVELTPSGLRWTKSIVSRQVAGSDKTNNVILLANCRLRTFTDISIGQVHTWQESDLPTFDADHDPFWANFKNAAQTPPITRNDAVFWPTVGWNFPAREDTSSGIVIGFEGGSSNDAVASRHWHLSGTRRGASVADATNYFVFQSAPTTDTRTMSDFPFPTDGSYPMGGGVQYPGGTIMAAGRHIFWGYHGEFRYNRQDNKYTHVFDNGLVLGIFGIAGEDNFNGVSPWENQPYPGLAGNNVKSEIIEYNGYYYIFHCDEGHHGAVHVWRIGGLATVKEYRLLKAGEKVPVTTGPVNSTTPTPTPSPTPTPAPAPTPAPPPVAEATPKAGDNIFDYSNPAKLERSLIRASDGHVDGYEFTTVTVYMPVTEGQEYSANYDPYWFNLSGWYSEANEDGWLNASFSTTRKAPVGAKFLRLSIPTDHYQNAMVIVGATLPASYVPYWKKP